MTASDLLRRVLADKQGAVLVEFAILGPMFIAMLMGIFTIGMQMQSYNALRSIGADVNRYAVVEYQKGNQLDENQIKDMAAAMAVRSQYNLSGGRIDVTAVEDPSTVTGTKKIILRLFYEPFGWLGFAGIGIPKLRHQQNIYLPSSS